MVRRSMTGIRPRVFMVDRTTVDVSDASRYGELIDVTERGVRVYDPRFGSDTITRMERRGYDPDRDYVLLAGGLVAVSNVVAALIRSYDKCRALGFHQPTGEYVTMALGETGTCE